MSAKILQTSGIANGYPAVTPSGAHDLVAAQARFTLAAALEVGDIIEMLELPPGCVAVDCILDVADLDTGTPAILLDVGVMAGDVGDKTLANRTLTANLIAGSNVGQAGGIARMAVAGGTQIAPPDNRRSIGVKVATGPGTGATSGVVALTVFYRPAIHGQ